MIDPKAADAARVSEAFVDALRKASELASSGEVINGDYRVLGAADGSNAVVPVRRATSHRR